MNQSNNDIKNKRKYRKNKNLENSVDKDNINNENNMNDEISLIKVKKNKI